MMAISQLLLGSALTPEQRELAETVLESGNSLLGILGKFGSTLIVVGLKFVLPFV